MGTYFNPNNKLFRKSLQSKIYIDKTGLLEYINSVIDTDDGYICLSRPRRFGKTLNMSMVEEFFSVNYAGRGDLFEGLSIWEGEKYQKLQGTYPVISLSFAKIKVITN